MDHRDVLVVLVLMSAVITPSGCQCDLGWTFNAEDERCYLLPRISQRTFFEAVESCAGYGATLVSVGSTEESDFIERVLRGCVDNECQNEGSRYWLGIRRTVLDSDFTLTHPIALNFSNIYISGGYIQYPMFGWLWLDGTPYDWRYDFETEMDSMGFDRWAPDQPVSRDPYVRCAVLGNGLWYSANCSTLRNVICEKASESTTSKEVTTVTSRRTSALTLGGMRQTTRESPTSTSLPLTNQQDNDSIRPASTSSPHTSQQDTDSTRPASTFSPHTSQPATNSPQTVEWTVSEVTAGESEYTEDGISGMVYDPEVRAPSKEGEIGFHTTLDREEGFTATPRLPKLHDGGISNTFMYIVIGAAIGVAIIVIVVVSICIGFCISSKRKRNKKIKAQGSVLIRPRPEFGGPPRNSPAIAIRETTDFDLGRVQSCTMPTTFKNSVRLDETMLRSLEVLTANENSTAPFGRSHSDQAVVPMLSRDPSSNRGRPMEKARESSSRPISEDTQTNLMPIPQYIPIRR